MVQKVQQFLGHLPQQEPSIISVHFTEEWLERLLFSNKTLIQYFPSQKQHQTYHLFGF